MCERNYLIEIDILRSTPVITTILQRHTHEGVHIKKEERLW